MPAIEYDRDDDSIISEIAPIARNEGVFAAVTPKLFATPLGNNAALAELSQLAKQLLQC